MGHREPPYDPTIPLITAVRLASRARSVRRTGGFVQVPIGELTVRSCDHLAVALSETGPYQVHAQNPFLLVALFKNPWFAIQFGVTQLLEICRVSDRFLPHPRR